MFKTELIKQIFRLAGVLAFAGVMAIYLEEGSALGTLAAGAAMLLMIWEIRNGWKRMEAAETPTVSPD